MNKRQKYALMKPVENAFSFYDPNYGKLIVIGDLRLSTLLTVELADNGRYQWHGSVNALGPDNVPTGIIGKLSVEEGDLAFRTAIGLLEGVGHGPVSTLPPGPGAIHVFRALSQAETAKARRRSPSLN